MAREAVDPARHLLSWKARARQHSPMSPCARPRAASAGPPAWSGRPTAASREADGPASARAWRAARRRAARVGSSAMRTGAKRFVAGDAAMTRAGPRRRYKRAQLAAARTVAPDASARASTAAPSWRRAPGRRGRDQSAATKAAIDAAASSAPMIRREAGPTASASARPAASGLHASRRRALKRGTRQAAAGTAATDAPTTTQSRRVRRGADASCGAGRAHAAHA